MDVFQWNVHSDRQRYELTYFRSWRISKYMIRNTKWQFIPPKFLRNLKIVCVFLLFICRCDNDKIPKFSCSHITTYRDRTYKL